jgi:hypothetical protein
LKTPALTFTAACFDIKNVCIDIHGGCFNIEGICLDIHGGCFDIHAVVHVEAAVLNVEADAVIREAGSCSWSVARDQIETESDDSVH